MQMAANINNVLVVYRPLLSTGRIAFHTPTSQQHVRLGCSFQPHPARLRLLAPDSQL